ncbi:hypothetical protein D3C75_1378650 [compost metagenome]
MLGLAGLALGEHRRVLDQPHLIGGLRVTLVGKPTHSLPDRLVSQQAKIAKAQRA